MPCGRSASPRDVVATVLPNGPRPSRSTWAPSRPASTCPDQPHWSPRSLHPRRLRGESVHHHERFAEVSSSGGARGGAAAGRFAVGAVQGFRSYRSWLADEPADHAGDRDGWRCHELHVGDHRQPRRAPALSGATPEEAALGLGGILFLFDINRGGQRPHCRLNRCSHRGPALRRRVDPRSATPWCS